MNRKTVLQGHILGIVCAIIWATSFLSSKKLLTILEPEQLMWMRFVIAYAAIWIIYPRWSFNIKTEASYLLMALFSNTLYFIAENNALRISTATNVSILVATAPILTAVLMRITGRCGRLPGTKIFGYIIAFVGVVLVVLNGVFTLKLNPLGDLLAICAGLMWAIYSCLAAQRAKEVSPFLLSRKLMFYGILTATPLMLMHGGINQLLPALSVPYVLYLLHLGLVCSAACYILWSSALKKIGPLTANIYIFIIPVLTLIASVLLLDEKITAMGFVGMLTVVTGMILSERKPKRK